MAKKQVTFADIAEYTHFSKLQYHGISIIPILLRLKIRKRFHRPLIPLAIKK